MKRSVVFALVSVLSTGCAVTPWSQTGSEGSDAPNEAIDTPDDPTGPGIVDPGAPEDPTSELASPTPRAGGSFSVDTPKEAPTPEPGSDLPMDGEFVSLAVGELDTVGVDSVYDLKDGQDVCGDHFRVARSDGMGNSLVIDGWKRDGEIEFAVHLDQLKRVNGHWQRLVAYVGPDFLDTEYSVDIRDQQEQSGDVVIHINRAIGVGPSQNGYVDGDLFVRLRGTCSLE